MVISPSLSMPFVRHPPKGFFSNLTISLPFTSKLWQRCTKTKSNVNKTSNLVAAIVCGGHDVQPKIRTHTLLIIIICILVDFDKLGLTDNENPFGDVPPLLARSVGRAAGGVIADYIGNILENRRAKRLFSSYQFLLSSDFFSFRDIPQTALKSGHLQGGERALLYLALEELLENFGLDGRACLLRAICEVHAHPMQGFGFVGEILKLFLR